MYQMFQTNITFGIEAPDSVKVKGFTDSSNPFIPAKDENYKFRKEFIRDFQAWLEYPAGDAMYIAGPTGSGKTSGVLQFAARINYPVQSVTCHGRLELSELIGQHQLVSVPGGTEMRFVHGPLAVAMREGHILLLNEIDLMDPAELSGLNDVLEGRPLVIAANAGEVIKPHPAFRIVVTGNSTGQGDATGGYAGVQIQNIAAMDRYRFIVVDYPDEGTEVAILQKIAPSIPQAICAGMVRVAKQVRQLFEGQELTVTMSTRTLTRWARLCVQFRGAPNALEYALRQALLNRTSDVEQEAIRRIAADVFGSQWG